jgi:hypothetical protein
MAKVAILTNFMDFNAGYSLTGIVKDQVYMLLRQGHKVRLFVNDQYNHSSGDPIDKEDVVKLGGNPDDYELVPLIPFQRLTDYKSISNLSEDDKKIIEKTQHVLEEQLQDTDFAFTHDFAFTGWFLIYGQACKLATPKLPKVRWLHWVHSVPSAMSDWWFIKQYGPYHKIVFPNFTDRIRVAEQYRGTIDDVRVIPHIKDPRTWFDFHPDTCRFIDKYPGVMTADIVQLLPASVDRLESKRVREVCKMFVGLKKQGRTVCLVIANQWATGKQQKQDVDVFRAEAIRNGLIDQKELIFTSDFEPPKFDVGIPQRMIRELFQLSNLFIFPTREESFGLVVPEAALSGVFLVLNKSLQMQIEVSGNTALYFDFGSFHQTHEIQSEKYWDDIGFVVAGRMKENEALMSKTFMRQTYNMDNLYHKHYFPTMAEIKAIK